MDNKIRSNRWTFFRENLRSPRVTGAVAPSSPSLVRAMLNEAAIERAQVIVEFGPGTGVFTDQIIRRMNTTARLLVLEVNPIFVVNLRARIKDERVEIITASAADVGAHLAERGLPQPDCIVSGLPFGSLPPPVSHAILEATRETLIPGGVFVTYQYTPFRRKLLRSYFPAARVSRLVLRNVPPALVFVCRKPVA
jgi:phosphatidylethanolamine/phosphatidyl-N-methylethanolamine N-methyltransferase